MVVRLSKRALALQGTINYGVIGDFPAPYFFSVDATTGVVRVQNDLKMDLDFAYTVWYKN